MSDLTNSKRICSEIVLNTSKTGVISTHDHLVIECPKTTEVHDFNLNSQSEMLINQNALTQDDQDSELFEKMMRVCRCCLLENDNLKQIFEDENCILSMLLMLSPIQISQNDGLPPHICEECLDLLSSSVQFKQQIENADMSLRHYIAVGHSEGVELQMMDIEQLAKTMSDDNRIEMEKIEEIEPAAYNIENNDDDPNADYLFLDSHMQDTDYSVSSTVVELHKEGHSEQESFIHENSCIKEEVIEQSRDSSDKSIETEVNVDDFERNSVCDEAIKENSFSNKFDRVGDVIETLEVASVDTATKVNCPICHRQVKNSATLESHLKCHTQESEHKVAEYQCDNCNSSFTNEQDLYVHGSIHVDEGAQLVCRKCEKLFTDVVKLKRHVRIHFEDKPFKCKVCSRGFPEMGALTRHFRLHTGEEREKKHACSMCSKSYYDSHSLSIHMRTHTGEKPWVCNHCDKAFIDSRLLNSHLKTHSEQKQYSCDQCDRKFTHYSTLVSHIRTHTGEKPYVCYICDKSFIQSSNLNLHMRVHSGEKPYKCDVCDRAFASSSTLTLHLRTHTGEKPYQCPQCGKSFARHSLNSHMRTHTGEKPFSCDKCSRRFTTSSQLNYHKRTHAKEKPYVCGTCGKKCSSLSLFTRHQKSHLNVSSIINEHQTEMNANIVLSPQKLLVKNVLSGSETASYLQDNLVSNSKNKSDET